MEREVGDGDNPTDAADPPRADAAPAPSPADSAPADPAPALVDASAPAPPSEAAPETASPAPPPEPDVNATPEPASAATPPEPAPTPEPTSAAAPSAPAPQPTPAPEPAPTSPELSAAEPAPPAPAVPSPAPAADTPPPTEPNAAPSGEAATTPAPKPEIGATKAATGPPPPPSGGAPGDSSAVAEGPFPGGTIVTGPVVELSAEEALIDLAEGKRGIVSRRHWSDPAPDDLTQHCAVGDMVVGAVLVRDDPKGRIVLSRAWAERIRAFEKLQAAYDAKETLTGTVIATVKGGLAVDVGIRAFLPRSVATLESNADLSKLVGETVECRVLEIDAAQNRAVLDRKAVLRAERNAKRNELLSSLTKGEIRTGTVRSIVEFGAFVDLGGAEGLIHISEMAWTRVDNPKDVVRVGQEVTVKVLEVRKSKKRVRLSLRGAEADPLDGLVEGSVVEGKVSRLADFGAFVDVGGVEGLVHLNELSEHRVFAPEEVVMPGEQVYVKVIGINRKRRRVDLSITQAVLMSPPPPADEASDPE